MLGDAVSVRLKIVRLRALLRKWKPAVMVVLDDRTVSACCWIRAALLEEIRVVAIQWAATHRADTLLKLRAVQCTPEEKSASVRQIESWVARLVPNAARDVGGELVWWMPSHHSLALRLAGAFPQFNPWTYGGGNAHVTAVLGDAWKERLVQDGVPPGKLQVTGHPAQDKWFHLRDTWTAQQTAAVKRDLGIESDRKIVTIIAPAMRFRRPGGCRHGDSSLDDIWDELSSVLSAIHKLGSPYVPVVKVHPRDNADAFRRIQSTGKGPVCLTRDYPVERLIAASHAMACQWSTTVVLGNALRVPVLVFNFHDSPSAELWSNTVGIRKAATPEQFENQLRNCLLNPSERRSLVSEGRQFTDKYLRLDGRATERLIAVLGQHGVQSPSSTARRAT
jgi:hypothetical protein